MNCLTPHVTHKQSTTSLTDCMLANGCLTVSLKLAANLKHYHLTLHTSSIDTHKHPDEHKDTRAGLGIKSDAKLTLA